MRFNIVNFKVLNSTNDHALGLAREGAADGTVVIAEYQAKGRGKFDRKWVSPKGKNLLFSIIVRPRIGVSKAPILTQLAAHAVLDILRKNFKLKAKIKRPNDILIRDKKICGILVEGSSKEEILEYAVVGIGLNVNSRRKELLPLATSIMEETKKRVHRKVLLGKILNEFAKRYQHTFKNA